MESLLYQAFYWLFPVREYVLVPALAAVVAVLMLGEWVIRRRRL